MVGVASMVSTNTSTPIRRLLSYLSQTGQRRQLCIVLISPAEYIESQGEQIVGHCVDAVLLQVVPHLLNLPVQVEVVSVPDWSTNLQHIIINAMVMVHRIQ